MCLFHAAAIIKVGRVPLYYMGSVQKPHAWQTREKKVTAFNEEPLLCHTLSVENITPTFSEDMHNIYTIQVYIPQIINVFLNCPQQYETDGSSLDGSKICISTWLSFWDKQTVDDRSQAAQSTGQEKKKGVCWTDCKWGLASLKRRHSKFI